MDLRAGLKDCGEITNILVRHLNSSENHKHFAVVEFKTAMARKLAFNFDDSYMAGGIVRIYSRFSAMP